MRLSRSTGSLLVSLSLVSAALVAPVVSAGAASAGVPAAASAPQAPAAAPLAPAAAQDRAKPKPRKLAKKKAKPPVTGHYNPLPGLRLNNPRGATKVRRHILNYLVSSIFSTPPGQTIKIQSWSLASNAAVDALLAAHKRGVGVQVVIDRGTTKPSNPYFRRLRLGLQKGNASRPVALRSFARTCISSCRGRYGIAHTKMYLFSQTGNATNVLMYGSANLTDLAAYIQWNDLYTIVNNPTAYDLGVSVFNQDLIDRPQANPVVTGSFGEVTLTWLPWYGANAVGDPAGNVLNQISCTGAAPGYGNSQGNTIVRVAQTALLDARGIALAQKLHSLRDQGCDVKMVYAIAGGNAYKALRSRAGRGPVPIRQLAIDRNGDGLYDRYLHQKSMTVNGVYAGNPASAIAWDGSSNWSQASLASDDTFAQVNNAGVEKVYRDFVNHWFVVGPGSRTLPQATAVPKGVDPNTLLELN